jgi:hypothetical protein
VFDAWDTRNRVKAMLKLREIVQNSEKKYFLRLSLEEEDLDVSMHEAVLVCIFFQLKLKLFKFE